jgi:thymidylate synthase (FAD)
MRRVEPKVFLVGETKLNGPGFQDYLDHAGASEWKTDAPSDGEALVEAMGRMCYRSWFPGMNANVTKIREGNDKYLDNILKSGHGSVTEHAVTNWIFADVSRVFTHELVRHRAGAAYSQESLRYVRLTDLGLWLPPEINDPEVVKLFETTFKDLEALQLKLAQVYDLDNTKNFHFKKVITSAMRRVAPIGLATSIGASFNFRSLRHIIEMRTAEGAEAEIRLVFDEVARIAKIHWPNIFADFTKDDKGAWVPKYSKV